MSSELMRPEVGSSLKIINEDVEELVKKTDHFNKFLIATTVSLGASIINPVAGIFMSGEAIRQVILTLKPPRHTPLEQKG